MSISSSLGARGHQGDVCQPGHDIAVMEAACQEEWRGAELHCTVLYCTVLYCTVLYCTVLQVLSYTLYKRYQRSVSTLTVPGTERQFTFKGMSIARPRVGPLTPLNSADTRYTPLFAGRAHQPPADQPISAPLFNSRSLCDC